jgi:hypothetical protein
MKNSYLLSAISYTVLLGGLDLCVNVIIQRFGFYCAIAVFPLASRSLPASGVGLG